MGPEFVRRRRRAGGRRDAARRHHLLQRELLLSRTCRRRPTGASASAPWSACRSSSFPTAWAQTPRRVLRQGPRGARQLPRAIRWSAPASRRTRRTRSPTRASSASACSSDQLDLPVHCHVHETAQEVEDSLQAARPAPARAHADRLGLVNDHLIAVHMTQLTDAEIAAVRRARRVGGALPGIEPQARLAASARPRSCAAPASTSRIGTDGCASNNDLDMFGEMRTAALLAKARRRRRHRAGRRERAARGDAGRRARARPGRAHRLDRARQAGRPRLRRASTRSKRSRCTT